MKWISSQISQDFGQAKALPKDKWISFDCLNYFLKTGFMFTLYSLIKSWPKSKIIDMHRNLFLGQRWLLEG